MIKAIVSDLARVLLFPKDTSYSGKLNDLHKEHSGNSNYKVLEHFTINTPLLDFYRSVKNSIPVYLFTSDVIQEAPELKEILNPVFEEVFSASALDVKKGSSDAYEKIALLLKLKSEDILFIDDLEENIRAADSTGYKTILYVNNEDAIAKVNEYLV